MKPIWTDTSQMPRFPMLRSEIHTDVLLIGGGIAGLLCACQLKNAGVDCLVAEAKTIAWGMTSSMVAARLLTDLITGKENPYAALFSPTRRMLRPQLGTNALEAAKNLISFSIKRCPHMGCALK